MAVELRLLVTRSSYTSLRQWVAFMAGRALYCLYAALWIKGDW